MISSAFKRPQDQRLGERGVVDVEASFPVLPLVTRRQVEDEAAGVTILLADAGAGKTSVHPGAEITESALLPEAVVGEEEATQNPQPFLVYFIKNDRYFDRSSLYRLY